MEVSIKYFNLFPFDFCGFMGRGRGKGRKLTVTTTHEEERNGFEEPLPPYKRRGRPQKPLKVDIDEDESEKIEEEEEEGGLKLITQTKETKVAASVENGKRRRRNSRAKENSFSILEENVSGLSSSIEESVRTNGFRQTGSRRKSKPRRAAGAGVEFY